VTSRHQTRRFILARYPDGNIVIVGTAGWAPRAPEKVYLHAVDTGAGVDLDVGREQSANTIPYTWPGKSPTVPAS
jgi:hypothetical protein